MANGDVVDPATLPATTATGDPMPTLVQWVPPVPETSAADWPRPFDDPFGPVLPHGTESARAKYDAAVAAEERAESEGQ